jgi:spore coat protein U-like protein
MQIKKRSKPMRKIFISLALLATASLYAGSTTGSTTVNGTAEQACSISNSPSLALGFTGFSDSTGNFNVDIVCNSGLAWTASVDGGSNPNGEVRRAVNGTDYLTYRLYKDAAMTQEMAITSGNTVTGTGSGGTDTINVYAKVVLADNTPTPPAATYSDTLNVTISW